MKKRLVYIALSALTVVTLFNTTAYASSSNMNYGLGIQPYGKQGNCTSRQSDLGLGGGVFVAGTTFCQQSYGQSTQNNQSLYGSMGTANYRSTYTRAQKKNQKIKQNQQYQYTPSYSDTLYNSERQESYNDNNYAVESFVPEYTKSKTKKQPTKQEKQNTEKVPEPTPSKSSGSHSW